MKPQDFHAERRIVLTAQDLDLGPHIQCLGRNNYAHASMPLEIHHHGDAVEFAYLAKGRQVYNTQNQDYILGAGDVFVALPNEKHSTADWPEEKGILYWIIVKIPEDRDRLLGLPPAETREIKKRLLDIPKRVFPTPPSLTRLFDAVFLAWFDKDDPLKRVILKARLLELLTALIYNAESAKTPLACAEINTLLTFIGFNLHKTLTVPDLANQMNLSVSWFKAKFFKNVGMSPAQYILARKIDRAKTLLAAGNRTVTDVALSLGFSSSGYFATVFKRFTNKNPSDYLP